MKFHENAVVRADLFHMDVQTSSHYEALSRFSQFSEGAKKEIVWMNGYRYENVLYVQHCTLELFSN